MRRRDEVGAKERFEVSVHSKDPIVFSDVEAVFGALSVDLALAIPPIPAVHSHETPVQDIIEITERTIDQGSIGKLNMVTATFVRTDAVTENATGLGYTERGLDRIRFSSEPLQASSAVETPLQTV